MRPKTALIACAATAMALGSAPALAQQDAAVSSQVRGELTRMADALKALTTYELRADVTTEEVLDTGQKIQSSGVIRIVARRPDRLFVDMDSERRKRRIYYDGKQVTIFGPVQGYYASVAAPPTTHQMVKDLADKFDLETPLADLFEWGARGVNVSKVRSSMPAGPDRIAGKLCDHYAFSQEGVDWQLWISRESPALPCKLVIVNTDDPSQPQTTAVLNWNVGQAIAESQFTFVPPAGAQPIKLAQAAGTAPKGTRR